MILSFKRVCDSRMKHRFTNKAFTVEAIEDNMKFAIGNNNTTVCFGIALRNVKCVVETIY